MLNVLTTKIIRISKNKLYNTYLSIEKWPSATKQICLEINMWSGSLDSRNSWQSHILLHISSTFQNPPNMENQKLCQIGQILKFNQEYHNKWASTLNGKKAKNDRKTPQNTWFLILNDTVQVQTSRSSDCHCHYLSHFISDPLLFLECCRYLR